MKKYTLGRNIVLWTSLVQLITTSLFFSPLHSMIFVPANIFEHVLAILFFAGLFVAIWGLVVKREYKEYRFSLWDVLFVALLVVTIQDYWYTLVTPHPLLNEQYYI